MPAVTAKKQKTRRPMERRRPDYPYTMRLPDGRTILVEIPGEWVDADRDGELLFTPQAARLLDRIRVLAAKWNHPPTPTYIATFREALGLTQKQLGERLGVDALTVSRWERGTVKPSPASMKALERVRKEAVRKGVVLPT